MFPEVLPPTIVLPPVCLCLGAVIALVISDFNNFRPGRYVFKPLAAAAFVWLALSLDATATAYGSWLLAGLLLCLLGDLFLMPEDDRSFLAGLTAFLCGHLLFGVAFFQLPHNFTGLAASALPVLVLLLGVRHWLTPHVEAAMKVPVALYVLVISMMLLCAGLTLGQAGAAFIIIGAWGFACSDLAVARRQFVHPSPFNGLWGTPLYFSSQLLLACSVAFV